MMRCNSTLLRGQITPFTKSRNFILQTYLATLLGIWGAFVSGNFMQTAANVVFLALAVFVRFCSVCARGHGCFDQSLLVRALHFWQWHNKTKRRSHRGYAFEFVLSKVRVYFSRVGSPSGELPSPSPSPRCMITLSTQRPSLKPADCNVPATRKPRRACSPIEATLAESPITATIWR